MASADEHDITLGEVYRGLSELKKDTKDAFEGVHRRLDGLQFVRQDVYNSEIERIWRELEAYGESKRFYTRWIFGLIGLIFASPLFLQWLLSR